MKKSIFFNLKSFFRKNNNLIAKDKQYELVVKDNILDWALYCENELIPFNKIIIGTDNIQVISEDLKEMKLSRGQLKFIESFELEK
jgi:hypothetical protein